MAGRILKFSRAAFAEAWLNPSLSRAEIAAMFDMSELHTWRVAKRYGLPPRKMGPRHKCLPTAMIRAAWLAGVSVAEICEAAGIVPDTLYARLDGLHLARRGSGARPKMTMADFRAMQLRQAMAADAEKCRIQFKAAEMVDGFQPNRWPGRAA